MAAVPSVSEMEITLKTTLGDIARSLEGTEDLLVVPLPVAEGEPPVLIVVAVGPLVAKVEDVLDAAMEPLPKHHAYEEKKPARPS